MPTSNKLPVSSVETFSEGATLNSTFTPGDHDISFSAYMRSDKGIQSLTNHDNYYMNGIFMKTFKFNDFKKSIENIGETAVFAISNGVTTDNASKEIFKHLDSKRSWLVSARSVRELKSRLTETILYCNNALIEEGRNNNISYGASLIIAVYYKEYVLYSICGGGSLFFTKKGRLSTTTKTNPCLGLNPLSTVNIAKKTFTKFERAILCSSGITSSISADLLMYNVANRLTPRDIVSGVFDQLQYSKEQDSTCMAIAASPTTGISTKTLIIAAVCLIITILNAVFLMLK